MYICPACKRRWPDENAAANGFVCYRSCDTPLVHMEEEAGTHLNYLERAILGEESGFNSIRDAFLAVIPGGIVEIPPGRYKEPVIIDKPVTLKNATDCKGVVYLETVLSPALKILSEDVVLINIVAFRGLEGGEFPLIEICNGCLKMEGCSVECRHGSGINVLENAMLILKETSINQSGEYAIQCGRGARLNVSGTSIYKVVVANERESSEKNTTKHKGTGIRGVTDNTFELTGLKVSGFSKGLELIDSRGLVEDLIVDDCATSIQLKTPDRMSFKNILCKGGSNLHMEIIGGDCSISNSSFVGGAEQIVVTEGKMTLTNSNIIDSKLMACRFESCSGTEVNDCNISGGDGNGMQMSGDKGICLQKVKIENIAGAGVIVMGGISHRIDNCEIEKCGMGLYMMSGTSISVSSTKLLNSRGSAVTLQNSSTGKFVDLNIRGSGADQFVVGKTDKEVTLEQCEISHGSASGIRVADGGKAHIVNCIVDGARGSGVILGKDSRTKLLNSNVSNCGESGILACPMSKIDMLKVTLKSNFRCALWGIDMRDLTIDDSNMVDNGLCGLFIDHVSSASLKNVIIGDNHGPGLVLVGMQNENAPGIVKVISCAIENNHIEGILGMGNLDLSISTGKFGNNIGPGIRIFGRMDVRISDCEFIDNGKQAVRIGMGGKAIISRCSFTGKGRRISLGRKAKATITDNRTHLSWLWKCWSKLSGRLTC